MIRVFSFTSIILFSFLSSVLWQGCSTSFPTVELNKNYDIQNKNVITVFVSSSGNEFLDDTYARVLCLDLQSRGYKAVNANEALKAHNDKIQWVDHRQAADFIINKKYLPLSDIIAVVKTSWDSIPFVTNISKESSLWGDWVSMKELQVGKLSSEVAFYDRNMQKPIMSFSAVDTTHVITENGRKDIYYPEFLWMVIARQVTANLGKVQICNKDNLPVPVNTFKVILLVDKSYRKAFPGNWENQLKLRFVYLNDILRTQLGIGLVLKEIRPWNSEFQNSLETVLEKLHRIYNPEKDVIRIGITLDKKLKYLWSDRAYLGLAYPLQTDAVISAQPTFPGLRMWGPLQEAITMAHEFGHLLGAVHVTNRNSIMYPSSAGLAYEFGNTNLKIINHMKNEFMKTDKDQLLKDYADEMIKIKNNSATNEFPILAPIAAGFMNTYRDDGSKFKNSERLLNSVSAIIPDSEYAIAVAGRISYKENYLTDARNLFTRVLNIDPDFAEAQWYLGSTLKLLGKPKEAKVHFDKASPYVKYWVIDK